MNIKQIISYMILAIISVLLAFQQIEWLSYWYKFIIGIKSLLIILLLIQTMLLQYLNLEGFSINEIFNFEQFKTKLYKDKIRFTLSYLLLTGYTLLIFDFFLLIFIIILDSIVLFLTRYIKI